MLALLHLGGCMKSYGLRPYVQKEQTKTPQKIKNTYKKHKAANKHKNKKPPSATQMQYGHHLVALGRPKENAMHNEIAACDLHILLMNHSNLGDLIQVEDHSHINFRSSERRNSNSKKYQLWAPHVARLYASLLLFSFCIHPRSRPWSWEGPSSSECGLAPTGVSWIAARVCWPSCTCKDRKIVKTLRNIGKALRKIGKTLKTGGRGGRGAGGGAGTSAPLTEQACSVDPPALCIEMHCNIKKQGQCRG